MKPDLNGYLESWAYELRSKAERVRQLIGDAHWLSDGHHKEGILSEFLSRNLHGRFKIKRGFIKQFGFNEMCSPEVDILISDRDAHPPFFDECGLQIVPSAGVAAHIEVKTTFSKPVLMEALQNIFATRHLLSQQERGVTWSGICFFQVPESRDAESLLSTLTNVLRQLWKENQKEACSFDDFQSKLPACLTIVDSYVIFLKAEGRSIVARIFETNYLSLACFVTDLYGSIQRLMGAGVSTHFDTAIEQCDIAPPTMKMISLEDE